jgi:hypothetical protein
MSRSLLPSANRQEITVLVGPEASQVEHRFQKSTKINSIERGDEIQSLAYLLRATRRVHGAENWIDQRFGSVFIINQDVLG